MENMEYVLGSKSREKENYFWGLRIKIAGEKTKMLMVFQISLISLCDKSCQFITTSIRLQQNISLFFLQFDVKFESL